MPDTIVALASGALPSGIAVVRMSGSAVIDLIGAIAGSLPPPRRAVHRTFRLRDGSVLDSGIVVYFPGPGSATGEDCGEFHVHGGRAVVDALLHDLCSLPDVRLAEAGEFARRAFLNGKIDLLGAEALADIIDAETEVERRFAISNGAGRHAALYAQWRARIIRARSLVEAELDFADEGDVSDSVAEQAWPDLTLLAAEIRDHCTGFGKSEIVQMGFDIVLAGPPNVGKSSLLNALAKRDVAIVTEEAGTTRDLVDVLLDVEGVKVRLTDTAGIRNASNKAERIGVERSLSRASRAQLLVVLSSPSDGSDDAEIESASPRLRVATKADLTRPLGTNSFDHIISVVTGEGLDGLLRDFARRAREAGPAAGDILPWKRRHVDLLQRAAGLLSNASRSTHLGLELRSEDLRLASQSLGRIAGDVDAEDLLDDIFSSFCIGK